MTSDLPQTELPATTPEYSPPLIRLPVELHQQISSYLKPEEGDGLSLLQLRRTCRYFRKILNSPGHQDLLLIEELFNGTVLTCKHCLRLRPASKFARPTSKTRRKLKNTSPHKRFCADCGFDVKKPERYCPGSKVVVDGVTMVYCQRCRTVKTGEDAGVDQCEKRVCAACYRSIGCQCPVKCQPKETLEPTRSFAFTWTGTLKNRNAKRYANPSDTESEEGYDDNSGRMWDT